MAQVARHRGDDATVVTRALAAMERFDQMRHRYGSAHCREIIGRVKAGNDPDDAVRFLTEADFPPFDYAGPDGNPAGFNVDLARLICDEIKVSCTIQARNFGSLLDTLSDNRGDAVIASIAPNAEARQRADFTDPYYRTPARFVARLDSPIGDVLPERLERKKIAVIAGTAHEAYLKAMFTEAEVRAYPNADTARASRWNRSRA